MKIPAEVIIIGTARSMEWEPPQAEARRKHAAHLKYLRRKKLEILKQDEFHPELRGENFEKQLAPYFLAVSKDYARILIWPFEPPESGAIFEVDKRGHTRNAFHRVNRYHVPALEVQTIGHCLELTYQSDLFDDKPVRPAFYKHRFENKGAPVLYGDNQTNPRLFMIKYSARKPIFHSGGVNLIGGSSVGQLSLGGQNKPLVGFW